MNGWLSLKKKTSQSVSLELKRDFLWFSLSSPFDINNNNTFGRDEKKWFDL